jgi:hypothetical protein
MAERGRNVRCPCGSGKKVKRCCGERRGPSDAELAWAFLAAEARAAARRELRKRTEEELDELFDEMLELPDTDRQLQLLPTLVTPDVEALLDAIEDDDHDWIDAALPAVVASVDTPAARAALARAVLALRDEGRISQPVAAVALLDLSRRGRSALVESAVIHAAGVAAGDIRTPGGLLVASR